MAVFLEGKTCCPICKIVIDKNSNFHVFPAMTWNELDALRIISDSVVHVDCLNLTGLSKSALARSQLVTSASQNSNRVCAICSCHIKTPDDNLELGYITDNINSLLFDYNLAQFHKDCLRQWNGLDNLVKSVIELNSSGEWRGSWLEIVQRKLQTLTSNSSKKLTK